MSVQLMMIVDDDVMRMAAAFRGNGDPFGPSTRHNK